MTNGDDATSLKPEYSILLVEDEASDAYLATDMLARAILADYALVHVSDLQSARAELEQSRFTLVLLDLKLPDGEGVDNITSLRELDRDVPIVVLSGDENPDIALKCIRSGAQDFLVKGKVSDWQLERAILYAIERRLLMNTVNELTKLDQLTGLANRSYFMSRFERALISATSQNKMVVVACFDVDDFGLVARHAQDMGDKVLSDIGHRMLASVRNGDTVARFGSDEFAILLEGRSRAEQVSQTLVKLYEEMREPFHVDGRSFSVTLSGGVASYPGAGSDVHTLMSAAISSMRLAKTQGRNRYIFFN